MSRDPFEGAMSRPMSMNGYTYVEGNVVNAVDPSGNQLRIPGFEEGVGGGGAGGVENVQEDEDTDDDEFDCSQYYALGYNFNFSDGTLISDYDLSYVSGIVHRGLAIGENPERGLIARAPGVRDVSPRSHNAGRKLSPWISASKSAQTAMDIFNTSGQGVVAINLALVPSIKVDLSAAQGLASRGMFRNAAIAHEEVLVLDCIPRQAIIN